MELMPRSQDVYEQIPAYPKPPMAPLPDLEDPQAYLTLAGTLTPFSLRMSRFLVNAIGLRKAYPEFSANIEHIQRSTNLRIPGLYAPVISAAINLADDPRSLDPYQRAATLLAGACSLADDLFAGRLPPDTLRGQPLEMGQYPNLFATSLVVENGQTRMFKSSNFDVVTVLLGGRIYQLQVGHLGETTSADQVVAALQKLVAVDKTYPDEPDYLAPGILTSAEDSTQIPAFSQMHADPQNHLSLVALRNSFLTICLDLDHNPETDPEAARLAQVGNPQNRWQHASFQLVVFGNGKACVICNFTCYLDGNVMMRGAAEIQRRAIACPIYPEDVSDLPPLPEPKRLHLKVDAKLHAQAVLDFQAVLDTQQATFEIAGYGRSDFIDTGVSAVQGFILGLAMAGRKLTGSTPRIVQFLSMSRYRCMDLFPAVITTPEVETCVEYLQKEPVEPRHALELIQEATASQEALSRRYRSGLSLLEVVNLYLLSQKKSLRRRLSFYLFTATMLTFKRKGYFKPFRRDIVISFPEIFPETPLIGRPGVRLPYVRQYGLHYQIFADKTIVTFMPAMDWSIPNQELIETITDCLVQIKEIVNLAKSS